MDADSYSADVNECAKDGTCDNYGVCNNTAGGYQCLCPEGKRMEGSECIGQ